MPRFDTQETWRSTDSDWLKIEENIRFGKDFRADRSYTLEEKDKILEHLALVWYTSETGQELLDRYADETLRIAATESGSRTVISIFGVSSDLIYIDFSSVDEQAYHVNPFGEIVRTQLYQTIMHEIIHNHPETGFLDTEITNFDDPENDYAGHTVRHTNVIRQEVEGSDTFDRLSYFLTYDKHPIFGFPSNFFDAEDHGIKFDQGISMADRLDVFHNPRSLWFNTRGETVFNSEGKQSNDLVISTRVNRNTDETFNTGGGDDVVVAAAGNDTVETGSGSDWVDGGRGKDTILGGSGADHLYGGYDSDFIFGGTGNDKIFGGYQTDILIGGSGRDQIWGEGHTDYFVFRDDGSQDMAMDFEKADDFILVEDYINGYVVSSSGSNSEIDFYQNDDLIYSATIAGNFVQTDFSGRVLAVDLDAVAEVPISELLELLG